jgi:hypothetical protein
MNGKKPLTNEQIGKMAAKAALQGPNVNNAPVSIDIELAKKGEDMKCMNQIPMIDQKTGKVIEGKTITCNGIYFVEATSLKYISPIISPTGQNTVVNLVVGKMCVRCGHIFNPDEWLKNREEKSKGKKKNANS